MSPTRLQIARKDIIAHFDQMGQRVLTLPMIRTELKEQGSIWRLAQSTTGQIFIDFLKQTEKLKEFRLDFPNRTEVRYVWEKASDYEIIQSVRPQSYFTHFTAVYLHKLTEQIPKTVYLNFEQTKGPSGGKLAQSRIDYAFRQPCRPSNNIAVFGDKKIYLLNGMFTGQKGVIDFEDELGSNIRVANLERTLIDIVVRPIYSGGVHTVLEAYKNAGGKVSVNKMLGLLHNIGYSYPLHQCIGFYLERSGTYTDKQIALVDKIDKEFDFYLTHQIKDKKYSKRWKLYYPSGL